MPEETYQREEATVKVPSDDNKPSDDEEKKEPTASSADDTKEADKKKDIIPLDEADIAILKSYGSGPYAGAIKSTEDDIAKLTNDINALKGIKESDTGLAPPSTWDLIADKQLMQSEQPLQVARCTKIINAGQEDAKYVINVRQIAKYVVGLGDRVSATDIEEGMRCGVDRQNKMQIQIPLPPKIDPSVTMMTVEEKPDVTYAEVGGCKEQIEKIREVVEMPMLNPERFIALGIDPPKGVLLYGPPGTGTQQQTHNLTHTTHTHTHTGTEALNIHAHIIWTTTPSLSSCTRSSTYSLTSFRVPLAIQPAQVKLCSLVPSPTRPTPSSFVSSAASSYRSTSVKVHVWSVSCSSWPALRRPRSCSSTRWTPSVERASTTGQAATTRYSERCYRSSRSWTASMLEATSRCSWPPTDPTRWTPH